MLKVIHVLTDTNIGGAGVWLINFLSVFDRSLLDVSVALPENAMLKSKVEALGIKVHEIEGIADSSFSKSGIASFKQLFKAEKPDVVHCHASLSARIAAKSSGIKVVNTRHCLEAIKPFPKSIIYGIVNSSLSDISIAVSGAVASNLRADGIPEKKLRLVYNGVVPLAKLTEAEKAEKRNALGISPSDTVVGIVARLEAVKHHEIFIDAARKLYGEKIKFLIIGTGSLENQLKDYANGLDNVIFYGYTPNIAEVADIIDIFALTSDSEACPLSLIEGMTLSKPCISTASGGPSEVITDGKSGFIVPVGDSDALADKIKLLASDEATRKAFGSYGKETANERFGVQAMANSITDIYTSLSTGGKR